MEGFFSRKDTESKSRPNGKLLSCTACGLYRNANSPKMLPYGNFKKGIMNIGETPYSKDDEKGLPWQGKSGKLLQRTYRELGVDIFEDCININATSCYSITNEGAHRMPTTFEIDHCRRIVLAAIEKYKPKVIVLFGDLAVYSVIGHRWKRDLGKITTWRGWQIPDQDFKAWICPTFSPLSVLKAFESSKTDDNPIENLIWKQDISKAVDCIKKPFPVYREPEIEIIEDLKDLRYFKLGNAKAHITPKEIAFDYETTGLKPHAEGHKIICCSIADDENHAYAFMMPQTRQERKLFTDLIINPEVGKIAQNMKYEHTWSKVRLGITVKNWVFDTMLAAHVLDNRPGITGLKFQNYVQFGIVDYDSEVSPYLRAEKDESANDINQIEKLLKIPGGKKKLLTYCGHDSINELRLANVQRKLIKETPKFYEAYKLLHDGVLALSRAELQGFNVDVEYIEKKLRILGKKQVTIEEEFKQTKFFKEWVKSSKNEVNIYSPKQLGDFLYKVKGIKPKKYTVGGGGSTDDEALAQLNIPELDFYKKKTKIKKSTDVLKGFLREQVEGIIHPFYNLHLVRTYRSSSDSPNFQNIPKRDEEMMKICRRALFPRPGHQLLEIDFSGLEVRIAACYHKDETMLKYIKDPSSDMHSDMAKQIFKIDKIDKSIDGHNTLRQAAKNGFVFPEFYGDYYKNCAENILCKWGQLPKGKFKKGEGIIIDQIGKPFRPYYLSDHLISKGIKEFGTEERINGKWVATGFLKHLKEIEHDFWNNRFKQYSWWKDAHYELYKKYGYFPLKTGFQCSGVMSKNDVINYPVQGAAFHCLLWSLIETDRIMREEKWDTKILGQIHDSMILDVHPDELQYVGETVHRITCEDLPRVFDWIIVPMDVDAELCPVDAPWTEKEKYKLV